jgi:hypothetical protein
MTQERVALDDLFVAREAIIAAIIGEMPADHGRFLVSFEEGRPDWTLLGLPNANDLPAVLWRQQSLGTLPLEKRAAQVAALKAVLGVG